MALMLVGCRSQPEGAETQAVPSEVASQAPARSLELSVGAPLAAFVAVVAEPATARSETEVRLITTDGVIVATRAFERGQRIELFEGVDGPLMYSLVVDGSPCTVPIGVQAGLETNVRLTMAKDGCSAEVVSRDATPHVVAYVAGRVVSDQPFEGLTVLLRRSIPR